MNPVHGITCCQLSLARMETVQSRRKDARLSPVRNAASKFSEGGSFALRMEWKISISLVRGA